MDMKKIIANKIYLLSITLLLSGCSVYKGSFDCKPHKGVGCESVSKVNELVNDNKLDEYIEDASGKKSRRSSCQEPECRKSTNSTNADNGMNTETLAEQEKITIHFNEYRERGVTYKESEIEVGAK